jgi:hypothetical protein
MAPRRADVVTVVTEAGDAGDSLDTALEARQPGHLRIVGGLSAEQSSLDYGDMYRLNLDPTMLQASTGAGNDAALIADPVLFLFDAAGMGVAMDDEGGGFSQALLRLLNTPLIGDYYLAIAYAGLDALDAMGNSIFDTFGTGAVSSSAGALASWFGEPLSINDAVQGRYDVSLRVPEPGTWALVALGLVPLLGRRAGRALHSASRA